MISPHPINSGWGFKLHGSKPWDSLATFASYGYNASCGGSFGYANPRHAVKLGTGYLHPLGISGEIAMASSRAQPPDRPDPFGEGG